jgi:hypothetical protein
MAKGFAYTKHFDDTLKKGIYETQVPNINFLYVTPTTTKDKEFDIGDRLVLADGREYRYAKSTGATALYASRACSFSDSGYLGYTAFATSHDAGSTEITIAAGTHDALTADFLRGGYVIIMDGATDYETTLRGIVGNNAADNGAAFTIQLDGQLNQAIVAGTHISEVYANPWSVMVESLLRDQVKAGVPTTVVSAAANYFWLQTKGICWPIPQGSFGNSGGYASGWWHDYGNVSDINTALGVTVQAANSSQIAGYAIAGSIGGNGPLFMMSDHG